MTARPRGAACSAPSAQPRAMGNIPAIIALAKDSGTPVREEAYTIEQWRTDAASGKLKEAFACGTAAVISPIGKVCSASGDFLISGGAAGPVAMGLRKQLIDIQYGRAPDPHNWIRKVL